MAEGEVITRCTPGRTVPPPFFASDEAGVREYLEQARQALRRLRGRGEST